MGKSPGTFQPKPLSKGSLDVVVEGKWRAVGMAPEDVERFAAVKRAERDRFDAFGPRAKRRMLRLGLQSFLGFGLVGWLLIDGSVRGFLLPATGGLAWGAFAHLRKPEAYEAGMVGAVAMLVASYSLGTSGYLSMALHAAIGFILAAAIGVGEALLRSDGSD